MKPPIIVDEETFDADRLSWFLKAGPDQTVAVVKADGTTSMVIGGSFAQPPKWEQVGKHYFVLREGGDGDVLGMIRHEKLTDRWIAVPAALDADEIACSNKLDAVKMVERWAGVK